MIKRIRNRAREKKEISDSDEEEFVSLSEVKNQMNKSDIGSVRSGTSGTRTVKTTTSVYDDSDDSLDVNEPLDKIYQDGCIRDGKPINTTLLKLLKQLTNQLEVNKRTGGSLNLENTYIGHNNIMRAISVLGIANCPIHTLSLKGCDIHSTVIPELVQVLSLSKSKLTSLDISSNRRLSYMAGRELYRLVRLKQTLIHINVDDTSIHPSLCNRIKNQIDRNKSHTSVGTSILLDSIKYHISRSFLSVHYPPVLVSFCGSDSDYVSKLCSSLSVIDPRLNGAFSLFYQLKTSPDYHLFIKTCFVEADYILVIASQAWTEDHQCQCELKWFHGRTTLVVLPELTDLNISSVGEDPYSDIQSDVVNQNTSSTIAIKTALSVCREKMNSIRDVSVAYVPQAENITIRGLCCVSTEESFSDNVRLPNCLNHVDVCNRFFIPLKDVVNCSKIIQTDSVGPKSIIKLATALATELSSSQSFTLPPKGETAALSKWSKLFVLVTQSLSPDNVTHVSLYPRLVKRMQQHRSDNTCTPFYPKIRIKSAIEDVIVSAIEAFGGGRKGAVTTGQSSSKKPTANVRVRDQKESKNVLSPPNQVKDKRSSQVNNIHFDVDKEGRLFYHRSWRNRICAATEDPTPLYHRDNLFISNPQRVCLRQSLVDEELRVSRERAALQKESRSLRISQRSLASKVRLINRIENRAELDKSNAVEPLQLLIPHMDCSMIREVRLMKEPRLTDSVRMCAKAVLILIGDDLIDEEGGGGVETLDYWWRILQKSFAMESQILYRMTSLIPQRVRRRQWNKIRDFLTNRSYKSDSASIPHCEWSQEALIGVRPRGAIALLARWVHCTYYQYCVSKRLEGDVYTFIDECHEDYKNLSLLVTDQEQRVSLLQTGVEYLQQHASEIIQSYSSFDPTDHNNISSIKSNFDLIDIPIDNTPLTAVRRDCLRILLSCPLLRGLPTAVVEFLARTGQVLGVEKKSLLPQLIDDSEGCLYIIITGRFQVVHDIALYPTSASVGFREISQPQPQQDLSTRKLKSNTRASFASSSHDPNDRTFRKYSRTVSSKRSTTSLGTDCSETDSGHASLLYTGHWFNELSFIKSNITSDDGTPSPIDEHSEPRAVSMGSHRGKPSTVFKIVTSQWSDNDSNLIKKLVEKNRSLLITKSNKIMYWQHASFLNSIGLEVLSAVASASIEEISQPNVEILSPGQPSDGIRLLVSGTVLINGEIFSYGFFPQPEHVITSAIVIHKVVSGNDGCTVLKISKQQLLDLSSTFSTLRSRFNCVLEPLLDTVERIPGHIKNICFDFNEQFQCLIGENPSSQEHANRRLKSLISLRDQFLAIAKPLADILISEIHKPMTEKLLPPIDAAMNSTAAGGQRYVVNKIFFELANNKGNIYGNKSNACKALKKEFRAWEAILSVSKKGICVPLCCLITCRGYRVKVMPILPVGDKSTIVHGGSSGIGPRSQIGKNLKESPEVTSILRSICAELNIKGHRMPGSNRLHYGPADMEIRRGFDGRLYVLRPGRLFPCQKINIKTHSQGDWLVQQLRPEAVKQFKHSLSSDALTKWGLSDIDNSHVSEACHQLYISVIPKLSRELTALFDNTPVPTFEGMLSQPNLTKPFEMLCERAHSFGVNIRLLAAIIALLPEDAVFACRILHMELIARTFRSNLWSSLRSLPKLSSEKCESEVVKYLGELCGNGPTSAAYWRDTLYQKCKVKFAFASLESYFSNLPTMDIRMEGVGRIEYLGFTSSLSAIKRDPDLHMMMLARICQLCGIKISQSDISNHYDKLLSEVDTDNCYRPKRQSRQLSIASSHSSGSRRGKASIGKSDQNSKFGVYFLDGFDSIIHVIALPQPDLITMYRTRGRLDLAVESINNQINQLEESSTENNRISIIKLSSTLSELYQEWGRDTEEGECLIKALTLCVDDLTFDDSTNQVLHSLDEALLLMKVAVFEMKHSKLGISLYRLRSAQRILSLLEFDLNSSIVQQCVLVIGQVEDLQLNHSVSLDLFNSIREWGLTKSLSPTSDLMIKTTIGIATAHQGLHNFDDCDKELRQSRQQLLNDTNSSQILVVKVVMTQISLLKLKNDSEGLCLTIIEVVSLCLKLMESESLDELSEAIDTTIAALTEYGHLYVSSGIPSSRGVVKLDELLQTVVSFVPELVPLLKSQPSLCDQNSLVAVDQVDFNDVLNSDVHVHRKRVALSLLIKQLKHENDFPQIEKLIERSLAMKLL